MPKPTENLPATTQNTYAVMTMPVANLREVMEANIGSGGLSPLDLDRIKVPPQGMTNWVINALEGEKTEPAIEGIIIHWREPRVSYSKPFGQGDIAPPDCTSDDGVIGIGNPGGECASCKFSQWGSAPVIGVGQRKGQACSQKRLLFFLRQDNMLPEAIFLPPTSIKPLKQYFLRLSSQSIPFYGVRTKLTLKKEAGPGGVAYSSVVAVMASKLSEDELGKIRAYIAAIRPALDRVKADREDIEEATPSGGQPPF